MVFVGGIILPHGALPFDNPESPSAECRARFAELDDQLKDKFYSLYSGSLAAAEELAACEPDLVILHTPHGICGSNSLCIYGNSTAEGTAMWNDKWSEFEVSCELDTLMAERLYGYLLDRQVQIEKLTVFSGQSCPLRWGEAIPIWYLCQKLNKKPKFLIMTHPRKPGTGQMEIEKLNVGRLMSDFIMTLDPQLRVAMAISGDLSHTYHTDCPNELYLPDPSYSTKLCDKTNNTAAVYFERAILGWVKSLSDISLLNKDVPLPDEPPTWSPGNAMGWLGQAAFYQPQALSCGMNGFMVLHGLLAGIVAKGRIFIPRVHTCEAPTYYGMMAATFIVKQK